jgi:hypothetical protein
MLTAINLNYKSPVQADEVRDVGAARMLPSELEFLEIPAPKQLPEAHFRICEGRAHSSCSIASC